MEESVVTNSGGKFSVLKGKIKTRTIVLNIFAEFIASILFSILYFIFISRYISPNFKIDYITLSYGVGLAYFAAVYIPFHTYRIHVIPFITIITALRKKQLKFFWYKIPAQILGGLVGVLLFSFVNAETTRVDVHDLHIIEYSNPWMTAFINFITAGILCYGFFIIRIFFRKRKISGTILMGLLISVIFAITGLMGGVSALNPFGILFNDILSDKAFFEQPWYNSILVHVIAPLSATLLVYFRLKSSLSENGEADKVMPLNEKIMKNYDI